MYQIQKIDFYYCSEILINHKIYLFISNQKLKNIKLVLKYDPRSGNRNLNIKDEFELKQDENNIIYLTENHKLHQFSKYSFNASKFFVIYIVNVMIKNLKIIAINLNF